MGTVLTQTNGDRLRKARKASGFTQAQMAGYLGVSRPTISAWEADDSDIPATKLATWARICDLTPNDLLTAGKSELMMQGRDSGRGGAAVVDYRPPVVTAHAGN